MGEHPLVSQALKAVFRLRPPLPQYKATFDIVPVLDYIRSLPTATIPLKLLSFKTLFLVIYSSISRVSSMARLAPSLEETRDAAIIKLQSLEKQSREGRIRGFFQIPRFVEDTELCPVFTLSTYFSKVTSASLEIFSDYSLMSLQVSEIHGDKKTLFLSYVKPQKSLTAKTLARKMKAVLTDEGVVGV